MARNMEAMHPVSHETKQVTVFVQGKLQLKQARLCNRRFRRRCLKGRVGKLHGPGARNEHHKVFTSGTSGWGEPCVFDPGPQTAEGNTVNQAWGCKLMPILVASDLRSASCFIPPVLPRSLRLCPSRRRAQRPTTAFLTSSWGVLDMGSNPWCWWFMGLCTHFLSSKTLNFWEDHLSGKQQVWTFFPNPLRKGVYL